MRSALEDLLALLLRYAPEYAENLALARSALELVEPVKNLLFRLIADAASVVKHQLGVRRLRNLRVALRQQGTNDLLRVVGVHLTAECFDIKRLGMHFLYCNGRPPAVQCTRYGSAGVAMGSGIFGPSIMVAPSSPFPVTL